jgi:hypothetical protein
VRSCARAGACHAPRALIIVKCRRLLTLIKVGRASGAHSQTIIGLEVLMTIRRLERSEWVAFCVHASHTFIGKQIQIEVASLEIGAQLEARRMPLLGLSYDPKSDVLEMLAGEMDHLIYGPREIYVDDTLLGLASLQIVDADGVRQIVTLADPLMLPPPMMVR